MPIFHSDPYPRLQQARIVRIVIFLKIFRFLFIFGQIFRKKFSVKYFTFIECHFFGLNNPVFLYLVNFQYLCIVCQKCKNMVCVFFSANFRNGCRKRPARHIELRLKKIVQKSRMEKNI